MMILMIALMTMAVMMILTMKVMVILAIQYLEKKYRTKPSNSKMLCYHLKIHSKKMTMRMI